MRIRSAAVEITVPRFGAIGIGSLLAFVVFVLWSPESGAGTLVAAPDTHSLHRTQLENTQCNQGLSSAGANLMFMQASLKHREAQATTVDDRLPLYVEVLGLLDQIVRDYPRTDLACRIKSGGPLGRMNVAEMRAVVSAAAGDFPDGSRTAQSDVAARVESIESGSTMKTDHAGIGHELMSSISAFRAHAPSFQEFREFVTGIYSIYEIAKRIDDLHSANALFVSSLTPRIAAQAELARAQEGAGLFLAGHIAKFIVKDMYARANDDPRSAPHIVSVVPEAVALATMDAVFSVGGAILTGGAAIIGQTISTTANIVDGVIAYLELDRQTDELVALTVQQTVAALHQYAAGNLPRKVALRQLETTETISQEMLSGWTKWAPSVDAGHRLAIIAGLGRIKVLEGQPPGPPRSVLGASELRDRISAMNGRYCFTCAPEWNQRYLIFADQMARELELRGWVPMASPELLDTPDAKPRDARESAAEVARDTASPAMAQWLEAREAALREIVETHSSRNFRGCAPAYGPIEPAFRRQLLEGMVLTVRDPHGREARRPMTQNLLDGDRFCLDANTAQCAVASYQLYYCPTGEAPFINRAESTFMSSVFQITQIEPQKQPTFLRGRKISQVFGSGDREIPVEGRDCTIYAGWIEPTSVRWNGECVGGKASGSGLLEWVRGKEVIRRTRIGPQWGMVLREGALHTDINTESFGFAMRTCDHGRAAYRAVTVTAPPDTSKAFFENTWTVAELMRLGAEFAQVNCPSDRRRYSNIVVSITADDKVIVRGRNYDQDTLTWGEFSNTAVRAMERELRDAERTRAAAKRQAQAQARADALAAEFQARRGALETETRHFLNTGRGTLEDLAAALDLDQIAALSRLEQGIQLRLGAPRAIDTVVHDGATHFQARYSVVSPFEQLERDFRSRQGFSWDNWMAMIESPLARRFAIGCLFGSADDIPRKDREVTASLAAFSSGGDSMRVSLLCRP